MLCSVDFIHFPRERLLVRWEHSPGHQWHKVRFVSAIVAMSVPSFSSLCWLSIVSTGRPRVPYCGPSIQDFYAKHRFTISRSHSLNLPGSLVANLFGTMARRAALDP